MIFPDLSVIYLDSLIFFAISLLTLIKIVLLISRYGKLAFLKNKEEINFNPPISVIICAKNEGENLTKFLPEILTQEYGNFEVIVVNDCSYDNTDDVLREFSKVFPNLKAITVKEDDYYKHGKKFALMIGIKGAKYDHLILTDADCKPSSSNWLKKMASGFAGGKEIVLGYGAYFAEKGLLNKLIRYDTFLIGIKYLSAAIRGKPYMGVGRNLGYKKDLFFNSKNFSKHYHLVSGDDDLFINQVANATNTSVIIDQDAITYSVPKRSWLNWKLQKARHLTTAPYYNSKTKLMMGSDIAFNLILSLIFILGFIPESTRISTGIALLFIFLTQILIYTRTAKQLNEKKIVPLFILLNVFLLIVYPLFHLNKKIYHSGKWMN